MFQRGQDRTGPDVAMDDGHGFSAPSATAHLRATGERSTGFTGDGSGVGLEWCPVPGGTTACRTSGPAGCVVTLVSFEITRTPVTRRQFARFVADGGYAEEKYWTVHGWRHRRSFGWEGPLHDAGPSEPDPEAPVTGVSWWEAMAFAWWAGATLPGEAQWRHAAGQSPRPGRGAVAAGGAPAGGAATLDLSGQVAEWCLDNPRLQCPGAGASAAPVHETTEVAPHVVRGGYGRHDTAHLHCTGLEAYAPDLRDNLIGFRLIR